MFVTKGVARVGVVLGVVIGGAAAGKVNALQASVQRRPTRPTHFTQP